jgi:hypothetical protein
MSDTQDTPSVTLPVPVCHKCGLPMEWKRTRRAFMKEGITTVSVYACIECEEITQVEGP